MQRRTDNLPAVVVLTGLSGSGMSSATNAFEDLGYFCVDNLPVTLLPTFAKLLTAEDDEKKNIERAALVINFREKQFLKDLPLELDNLTKQNLKVFVIFFEAREDILQRRFSETRRPHPADNGIGLPNAISIEREAMQDVRKLADLIVDTSEHTVHSLRRFLIERFSVGGAEPSLRVQLVSFGHKYGAPRDLDLLFDVRHLPNPYFVLELRELSGGHSKIVKYLQSQPSVIETIERFLELLVYLLPFYQREGKSYLTVGVGCTGGRHRSVMVANALKKKLRQLNFDAHVTHRDIKLKSKQFAKQ